jgi:hypothetical protein
MAQSKKSEIFKDTVLRKDGAGNLFFMNHPEKGWRSYAIPILSEERFLETHHAKLGEWTKDEFGDCCPVFRVDPNAPQV